MLNVSLYLSINDKDKSSCAPEDHLVVERGVKEVHLARKVPDLKIDKGATGDVILVDFVGAFQEQGLIRRHLVKHHLTGDKCLRSVLR